MLIEERRRPSMLSSMCQHVEGLTLRCGPSRVPGCKFRFCVQQMICYWDHMSHPGFLNWFDTGIVCQYKKMPMPQSCIEALTIESGLSLPFTFRSKKPAFLPPSEWAPWGMAVVESPNVARLQFDGCAKKDSLCGTVMIYDGLNLRCLEQCHCVRSRGKSSSQNWRKRLVIQQPEFSL